MSNSSFFSNASLPPPHTYSSNSSFYSALSVCSTYTSSFLVFTIFSVTNVLLLLPLCILVLYLGVQQWRRQRSTAASHSDVFTYNMVAMEMFGIFGCGLYCYGACVDAPLLMMLGIYFFTTTTNGQIPFHILTCVERHLAVVHPITYQGLKKRVGVRIRNVTIACVWLFSLGLVGLAILNNSTVPFFCVSIFSLAAITFSSLSVLCALIRPGPGERGGNRERVDQSKMRVFHIIMAILGTLLFRFWGHLLVLSVYTSVAVSERVRCEVAMSGVWFGLPSSLVLPLLFLHRAGKLLCCRSSAESDQGSQ